MEVRKHEGKNNTKVHKIQHIHSHIHTYRFNIIGASSKKNHATLGLGISYVLFIQRKISVTMSSNFILCMFIVQILVIYKYTGHTCYLVSFSY